MDSSRANGEIELPYEPGKTVSRAVSGSSTPIFDKKTRTMKVSIELPNPRAEAKSGHVRQCHY